MKANGLVVRGVIRMLCLGLLLLMLAGCQSTISKMTQMGVNVLTMEDLDRDEYVILDTVEGHGRVTRVLYIFTFGDKQFGYTSYSGLAANFLGTRDRSALSAATYDALSKVKSADVILPLSSTTSQTGFPILWSTTRSSVRGKAIRIKTDSELYQD